MTRTSTWFVAPAMLLAACATADGPGSLGTHEGGVVDSGHDDVKPGTDTGGTPDEDTGGTPDEDTGTGPKDTAGGSDTATCTIPTGKKCGTVPQCGCDGKNCDITKVDGTRACVAAGASALHDKCTAAGQCAAGLSCIAGNCLPFCEGTEGCPSGTCTNITTGGTSPTDIPGYKVCFEDCDPVSPAAVCGAGNCSFNGPSDTVCTSAGTGTGTAGCPSTTPFGCAAGYVCLSTFDCAKWCRIGFPGDCTGGKTCKPLATPPSKAGVEYGVCG